MPKVSIIVPVYKVEAYLTGCLDSLRNQTETDLELLLADDGSPDGSAALCDECALLDDRAVVIHAPNGGVSAARNHGIEAATAPVLMFADSDDAVSPWWVATLLSAASDAALPLCRFSTSGYDTPPAFAPVAADDPQHCKNVPLDHLADIYFRENFYSLCNKAFQADVIARANLRITEGKPVGEDLSFVADYLQAMPDGQIVVFDYPLYHYYGNPDSATHRYQPGCFEFRTHNFGKIKALFSHYGCHPGRGTRRLYSYYFHSFYEIFENTLRTPGWGLLKKIRTNSSYMHTPEFADLWQHLDKSRLSWPVRFAWASRCYLFVYLIRLLVQRRG